MLQHQGEDRTGKNGTYISKEGKAVGVALVDTVGGYKGLHNSLLHDSAEVSPEVEITLKGGNWDRTPRKRFAEGQRSCGSKLGFPGFRGAQGNILKTYYIPHHFRRIQTRERGHPPLWGLSTASARSKWFSRTPFLLNGGLILQDLFL
ncbi:hypothetical protein TNCV_382741 [Trichonephila clavipes]|nr:hypothetical protein TNCV_382741 [Trichonephila clavipes]